MGEIMSIFAEKINSLLFSKNPKITQLFQLCVQPKTVDEMETILLDFWSEFEECTRTNEKVKHANLKLLDIFCMYVIDLIYKQKNISMVSVTRSLYIYLRQIKLPPLERDRDAGIKCRNSPLFTELETFTGFDSSEGEAILRDAALRSIYGSHYGLVHFLVKFGFIQFPTEVNEKSKLLVEDLLIGLHFIYRYIDPEYTGWELTVNEFCNRMKKSKIGFRRCILMLFTARIIFEYRAFGLFLSLGIPESRRVIFYMMKTLCFFKFRCLNKYIQATPEAYLTLEDMKSFQETFLNSLPNGITVTSLLEVSREFLSGAFEGRREKFQIEHYNPRSLKDLARCKTRECMQNSKILPQDVYRLVIPETLKEFLLFGHKTGILDLLQTDQVIFFMQNAMARPRRH